MSEEPQGISNKPGRRLMLLRHAKSAWPAGVADDRRPLSERGSEAASLMGDYMAREGLVPDLALVSTARRTQETWALVRDKLPGEVETRNDTELYAAPAAKILDILTQVEPAYRDILIIGHNPGIGQLALLLSGSGDADARGKIAEKYPTAALAVIDFDGAAWQGTDKGSGHLWRFVTPRSLA